MKPIPFAQFCSKDYQPFSTKADVQKLVNLYRERVQSGDSEFDYCLIKTPGLRRQFRPSGGNGRFRGSIELNEHVFVVVDATVYDFDAAYNLFATYGPIANDGLPVFMQIDNLSLGIVSAGILHMINSGALSTPATPTTPIGLALIRGYWVIVGPPTPDQVFYFSTDGLTWNALDFQSAEGAPNNIVAMIVDHEELWMIGNRITQVFTVGTDPDTPFVPRADAVVMEGTVAASSVCAAAGSLFWLARNKEGQGTVCRMNGYTPMDASTYAQSNTLRTLSRIDDAIAQVHRTNGHTFVRFTFPAADRTLEYDVTENDWHEVAAWNLTLGQYERHRGNTMVAAFGKILVGDHTNGWLYEMMPDVYDEETADLAVNAPIRWNRRCPHLTKNGKKINYGRMEVFGDMGRGLAVDPGLPGHDPQISMRFSDDAGETWSSVYNRSLGKMGEYRKKAYWNRLGEAFDRVFDFYGDSPTKIAFTGACFDAEAAR